MTTQRDCHGQTLAAVINIDDREFNLYINIYVPRSDSKHHTFYKDFKAFLTNENVNDGD